MWFPYVLLVRALHLPASLLNNSSSLDDTLCSVTDAVQAAETSSHILSVQTLLESRAQCQHVSKMNCTVFNKQNEGCQNSIPKLHSVREEGVKRLLSHHFPPNKTMNCSRSL